MDGKQYAYRKLWQEANGPLTPDIVLHHECENSWCVNIEHLSPITQGEHLTEHGLPGDWGQADKTHCPAGHEYTPENTYTYERAARPGKGISVERHCKTCRQETKRRYRERLRAQRF